MEEGGTAAEPGATMAPTPEENGNRPVQVG